MKNFMYFLITILIVTVTVSCSKNPTEPPVVEEFPTVQFTTSNSGGDETVEEVQLELSLSKKSDKDVSVKYTLIIGGTADDNDYNLNNGVVTIAAGEVNANITFTIVDDDVEEGDETIIVGISNPTNATLGDQLWHTYVIADNELSIRPVVQFTSPTSSIGESSTSINIEVSLSEPSNREIFIDYAVIGGTATANDTDFTLIGGTITFDIGSVANNITLTLTNDDLFEQNETVIIAIFNPINATVGDQFWHTHTILDDEVGFGKISLIPLSADGLSKAITDANGQMWLPAYEVPTTLMKTTSAAIDFGEINATTDLLFVIMNTGNKDVFDVQFTANNIDIVPGNIGLIKVPIQGTEVTALPIITITKEHVLPKSGVGSLLDMSTGSFLDTLKITYYFEQGSDTIKVVDDYDVEGVKMGAIIEFSLSGLPLQDYSYNVNFFNKFGYLRQFISVGSLPSSGMDTIFVHNNGNAPLPMQIINQMFSVVVLDTTLHPGINLDISGLVRGIDFTQENADAGSIILLGATTNQPYIFKAVDLIWTNGACGIEIDEHIDN